MIKQSKKNIFNNAIQDGKSTKHLWNNIKSVSNNSNKKCVIPNSISKDTQDDFTCVLNSLNQHFIDISDIVSKSKFDKDTFKDLENKLNYKLKENKFELEYITPCKVSKYINKLNVNKSTGIDGIGPNILKMCKDHIVLAITALINNCIGQGIFSDKLKIASIIHDPHNYRPISILHTLSKVFENIKPTKFTVIF